MMEEGRLGRPRGTGATTIRVAEPRGNTSHRLFIGRALWQQIGEPSHVAFERRPRNLVIYSCSADYSDSYTVIGASSNTIPRIGIGEKQLLRLGLVIGIYQAYVYSDFEIRIPSTELKRVLWEDD